MKLSEWHQPPEFGGEGMRTEYAADWENDRILLRITEPGWPDVERWRPASDLAGPFEPWNEVPQFLPGTKWREYE